MRETPTLLNAHDLSLLPREEAASSLERRRARVLQSVVGA